MLELKTCALRTLTGFNFLGSAGFRALEVFWLPKRINVTPLVSRGVLAEVSAKGFKSSCLSVCCSRTDINCSGFRNLAERKVMWTGYGSLCSYSLFLVSGHTEY